jgi:hypothetical protein
MSIIIETVRDHHERGYTLSCWCPKCKKHVGDGSSCVARAISP